MGKTPQDTVTRSVRLPAELDERLAREAHAQDRSVSYMIRRVLEAALVPKDARSAPTASEAFQGDAVIKHPSDGLPASVKAPKPVKPKVPPVARDTQRDANAEYARMMAERQARLEKGR